MKEPIYAIYDKASKTFVNQCDLGNFGMDVPFITSDKSEAEDIVKEYGEADGDVEASWEVRLVTVEVKLLD